MATYTTKLGLRKPSRMSGSDDIIEVEADVNSNLDIIDQNINMRVALSGARPTSPFTGQMIFETDTNQVRMWNGTAWVWVGCDHDARGRVGYAELGSTGVDGPALTSASAETLYLSTTISAESDRLYWIETGFHVQCQSTSAAPGTATINVRWKAGASVANTDALLGGTGVTYNVPQGTGTGNSERGYLLFELTPAVHATTGNLTVGVFMKVPNAGDTMLFDGITNNRNWLSVRDVGI